METINFTGIKNTMKKILIILIGLLYLNELSAQKYTSNYIKDANKAGLEWWNQVNDSKYEKAYTKFSSIIKDQTDANEWASQMSILMNEVGNIEQRKVKNTYFKNSLEGFGDGFYVIIEYDVKYSKTRNHIENLVLKQSDNFEWEILIWDYTFQGLKE
tara:strand:- start:103 stop:576 length:474 start_codon:yes stop_codon:yes gene_type:complete